MVAFFMTKVLVVIMLCEELSSNLTIFRSTYGLGLCAPRSDIAFSDPTSHGKSFAERYTGTQHFLVYKP